MSAARGLAGHVGVSAACEALGVARATFYRRRRPKTGQRQPRPAPARALGEAERTEVFRVLCSPRFTDRAPAEVYATLLDEGVYLCSERTMYRILAENRAVRERRAQRSHPNHPKPEIVARAPNEVWSWDITRLLGPEKWQYFYLYVILDIFSRYVTGWMVADRETAGLGGRLIEETCLKQGVQPRVLTLHSGQGSPHDGQMHGAAPGRPRRHAVAEPSPDLERQPVLGGALQDRQVPPRLPRPVRRHRGGEGTSAASSSRGTTPSTGMAASACSRPSRSTSAGRPRSSANGRTSSPPPMPPGPSASWPARPGLPNSRRRSGSTAHSPSVK